MCRSCKIGKDPDKKEAFEKSFLNSDLISRLSLVLVVVAAVLAPVMYKSLPSCIHGQLNGTACVCVGPAYGGPSCADILCANGLPSDDGNCDCANLWHGDLCDQCNAQSNVDSGGPCLFPCFENSTVLYYGEKCELACSKEMLHGTCTADGPVCDADHYGASCESTCVGGCPANHVCGPDATCICAAGYYGEDCAATCGPPESECSGHGTCLDGKCTCTSDFYRGELCEALCPGDTTYGEVCSGHGSCAATGNGTAECTCEEGWKWSSCLCNDDLTCFSNGVCKPDESGCLCISGYTESSDCRDCAAGFVRDSSGLCVACSCSGHGSCEVYDDGVACACDEGWGGSSCSECAPDYYGPTCSIECTASKCNNRGTCDAEGSCVCDNGFDGGTDCKECAPIFYPKRGDNKCSTECNCNGHGTCNDYGECQCEEPFTGPACLDSCTSTCAAHGTCIVSEDARKAFGDAPAYCRCDEGYYGTECNYASPQYNNEICGGNGRPVLVDVSNECSEGTDTSFCAPPSHPYGTLDESCRSEYFNIAQYDWHQFCVEVVEGLSPVPCIEECGVDCDCPADICDSFEMCATTGSIYDDECNAIQNEVNCLSDPHCKFERGECKGIQCTDVRAPFPPAECLPLIDFDESVFMDARIRELILSGANLPVPPPVEVFSNRLYTDGALSDCDKSDVFAEVTLKSSNHAYYMHCLMTGERYPITDISVAREQDCFIEMEESDVPYPRPEDFDVYTSAYSDCARAGLDQTCAGDPFYTRFYVDLSQGGVQFYAKDKDANAIRVSGSSVYINDELQFTVSTPYLRVEIESEVTLVLNDNTLNVTGPFTSVTATEVQRVDAQDKECALRFDQVSGHTNYTAFSALATPYEGSATLSSHVGVCTTFATVAEFARCGLKHNTEPFQGNIPQIDIETAKTCYETVVPWQPCGSECAQSFNSAPQQCGSCSTPLSLSDTFDFCTRSRSVQTVPYDLDINTGCRNSLSTVLPGKVGAVCADIITQANHDLKTPKCECDAGFAGVSCEINCPIDAGLTCSGNGNCNAVGGATVLDTPHKGGAFLQSDVPIMGRCDCVRGSGSSCIIPCDDCNNAAYTLRHSQRGVCNEANGQCEALPPGIAMDFQVSNDSTASFDAAGRLLDAENLKVLGFSDIANILVLNECYGESIEATFAPSLNSSELLKVDATGDPYAYLPPAPPGFEKLDSSGLWSWYSNTPKTINTSTAVFSGSFPYKRSNTQVDTSGCTNVYNQIYSKFIRILQMQGNFNAEALKTVHLHIADTSFTTYETILLPEFVDFASVELPPSMENMFTATIDLFPHNRAYVIDLIWHGVGSGEWFDPMKVHLGTQVVEITSLKINEKEFSAPLIGSHRIIIEDGSVYVSKYTDTDKIVPFKVDLEMAEVYRGRSGFCGYKAEHECPAQVTDLKIPCSGRGICSRSSCTCTCDPAPEAALRNGIITSLEDATDFSPYRGDGCEHVCPGYDGFSMSSICSGHGTCNSNAECECVDGYVGSNCAFKCPSLDGYTCNNHGSCYIATVDIATVNEKNQNALNAIQSDNKVEQVLFTFESKTSDADTDVLKYTVEKSCMRNVTGSDVSFVCAVCDCDTRGVNGLGSWTGGVCSQCAHDVYGSKCHLPCPNCGEFGVCDFGITGSGTCLCGESPFQRVTKGGSVFSRTLRDDTVFLNSVGSTGTVCDDVHFQSAESCPDDCTFSNGACTGAGQGYNFDPSSPSCDRCLDGFSGPTCSHNTLPCLFGGTPVFTPFYLDECTCLSPVYDPDNHCCPFTFKLVNTKLLVQHADNLDEYGIRNIENWSGENGICKMCPLYDNGIEITDTSDILDNLLKYVPNVCDGRSECIVVNGDTFCDCSHASFEIETTCPNGQYKHGMLGACNERIDCRDCGVGMFLTYAEGEEARTTCDECPAGKYNNQVGQATCKDCPAGYYNTHAKSHSCTACPKGKFQNHNGKTSCKYCPHGTIGTHTGMSSSVCNGYVTLDHGPGVHYFYYLGYTENDPQPCVCGSQCPSGNCHNCPNWEGNCQGCRSTAWDSISGQQFCVDCLHCAS